LRQGRPTGDPDRLALAVPSDFPEAVELVSLLYDEFGFDAVDNGVGWTGGGPRL
jgi:predicted dinucleotide-binding enzyme